MKKYIKPEVEIYRFDASQIIASSMVLDSSRETDVMSKFSLDGYDDLELFW